MESIDNKKRRKDDRRGSSSTSKRRRRHDDLKRPLRLKDLRKLSSNDKAFFLPKETMYDIIQFIQSRKTPTHITYENWDEYAASFYLKMCTFFGVDDHRYLEAAPSEAELRHLASLKEQGVHTEFSGVNRPSTIEAETEKQDSRRKDNHARRILYGPFKFGSYSSGTKPERIPYPLYLLVKKAADMRDLKLVELKIWFFCHFFRSHLPRGWTYDREKACSLIAAYDTTRGDSMAGYKPICLSVVRGWDTTEFHVTEDLAREAMVAVMGMIHSRKTPKFWRMDMSMLVFYYKICSCFGLDFCNLEAASEDDVCLMIT